jgi:bifunctional pyridoxal-dependent enzyme with beta-cystathionase and maltose regulon repressor activities
MRFNFGCPRDTLEHGIARLEAAVRALDAEGHGPGP